MTGRRRRIRHTQTIWDDTPPDRPDQSSLAAIVAASSRAARTDAGTSLGQPSDTDARGWSTLAAPPIPRCACELCLWASQFPVWDRPCRCDQCKTVRPPAPALAVLYAQPDAVWLGIRAAVREGRYADIDAAFDDATERCRKGFAAASRHVFRALDPVARQVEALRAGRRMAA